MLPGYSSYQWFISLAHQRTHNNWWWKSIDNHTQWKFTPNCERKPTWLLVSYGATFNWYYNHDCFFKISKKFTWCLSYTDSWTEIQFAGQSSAWIIELGDVLIMQKLQILWRLYCLQILSCCVVLLDHRYFRLHRLKISMIRWSSLIIIPSLSQVGRKALLLSGAFGMLVSIVSAGVVIQTTHVEERPDQVAAGYVVVILVCVFVFNFAFSWGWAMHHRVCHLCV